MKMAPPLPEDGASSHLRQQIAGPVVGEGMQHGRILIRYHASVEKKGPAVCRRGRGVGVREYRLAYASTRSLGGQ